MQMVCRVKTLKTLSWPRRSERLHSGVFAAIRTLFLWVLSALAAAAAYTQSQFESTKLDAACGGKVGSFRLPLFMCLPPQSK